MPAIVKQLGSLLAGQMTGSTNKANFIVKSLRTVYIIDGTLIIAIWYSAWRNEHVSPGSGKFPFPGVTNLARRFKPDRPDATSLSGESGNQSGGGPERHGKNLGPSIGMAGPVGLNKLISWCNRVSGKYPYVWGGGHAQIGIPSGGGFDCSGAISGAIGQLGKHILAIPIVSGDFPSIFPHGEGRYITIYANPEHVFMKVKIGEKWIWFGTGSDKEAFRGGAAWGNHDPDLSAYTACHPPGY